MPEPYNVVAANRQAVQSGLALGRAMFDNAMRMQQFQSEAAMRRLQEQQLAQQIELATRKYEQQVQDRANAAKAAAAYELYSQPTITENVELAGPPEPGGQPLGTAPVRMPNPAYIEDAGLRYIKAAGPYASDPEKLLLDAATVRVKQMQEKQEAPFKPSIVPVPIPGSSESALFGYTSPKSGQYVAGDLQFETDPATGQRFYRDSPVGRVKQDVQGAQAARQAAAAQQRMAESAPDLSVPNPQAPGLRTIPERNFEKFAQRESITPGTRSKIEQQQLEVSNVFRAGKELSRLLTPENVGLRGNVSRLWDGIASQINPDHKIGTATDASTVAAQFRAGVIRGMRSDSNIAEHERQTLEDAMPQVNNFLKGPAQAKSTLARILKQWGEKSRENAQTLGKPVFPQWLTKDEVTSMYAQGLISREEADALRDSNGWALIESLQRSALKPGAYR